MDAQKKLELDVRITEWKKRFEGTLLTETDIEELAIQLKDTYIELLANNLSDDEAWLVATHRMGAPEGTKEEAIPNANSEIAPKKEGNRSWMMMLWGAMAVLILQGVFIVMPQMFNHTINSIFKPGSTSTFLTNEFYSIAVILIVLFILGMARSGYIVNKFTNSLTRQASLHALIAVIAGLWAGFCSYITFVKYPIAVTNTEMSDEARMAFSFMMFGFYFPLIFVTVFATIAYYRRQTTTFADFCRNLNWKHALVLGLLAQTPVQFSHIISANDTVREAVIIGISVVLFATIGWMISYSLKAKSSLAAAQAAPLFIWIMGSVVNEEARMIFFIFFAVKILAMLVAYFIGKRLHHLNEKSYILQ